MNGSAEPSEGGAQNKTSKGSVIGRTSGPISEIMSRQVIEQREKLDNS